MATIHAERTPNPNSLKFTASEGRFRDDVAAFSSASEAEADPLASKLFSLPDVEDVFITPEFVTVSKQADAAWGDATSAITDILQAHLEEA
jgi:hypothetical protein